MNEYPIKPGDVVRGLKRRREEGRENGTEVVVAEAEEGASD